jgi:kumamolisin
MASARARPAAAGKRARRAPPEPARPPPAPIALTLYLREPDKTRRRAGSAAAIAELSLRIDRDELRRRRVKQLKAPIAAVRRFAKAQGMAVFDVDPLRRRVRLRAAPERMEKAFATRLREVDGQSGRYRCPARTPRIAKELADLVEAVLGFDERPRIGRLREGAAPQGVSGFYPSAIAGFYGIAAAGRGAGQCIALIEPAGGYDPNDLNRACQAMNVPSPAIVDIGVGKGRNAFGVDPEADKEVSLDVQVLAGVAPEAKIAVYFTENSETGIVDGLTEAVHDATHKPNVIVITWGEPEARWPPAARAAFDAALEDAVRLGVTVVAAAGDDLAPDRMRDNLAHVDYPASSPYVLGCGGTRISLDAAGAAIVDEVVWNDGRRGTGGGVSDLFQVPAFQASAQVPPSVNDGQRRGRGVPDVAAAAAEVNGYRLCLRSADIVTGGTSAVAPLWGAFIALLNAQRGAPLGFVNPILYRAPDLMRAITSGDNVMFGVGYEAGPGWNACTGLGAPAGAAIIAALTAIA